jgi:transcriptional regulator of NAD metabolism
MGMLAIVKDWGVFQDKKINIMELSTGKILEENLVQSAFHQTLVN